MEEEVGVEQSGAEQILCVSSKRKEGYKVVVD